MPNATQPVRRRRLLRLALPAALALACLSLLAGSAFPKTDPDPGGPQEPGRSGQSLLRRCRQ